MPETNTQSTTTSSTPEPPAIPEDYAEFERYRETGELPKREAAEEPPADGQESSSAPAAGEGQETAPDEGKTAEDQDASKDSKEQGEKKPEVPPGVQKRIDKAIARQREAERRAQELERQLAELREAREGEPAEKKPEPTAQPKTGDTQQKARPVRPNLDDYEGLAEYEAALEAYMDQLTDWKLERAEQKRREREIAQQEEARRKAAETARQAAQDAYAARLEEARSRHADYDDVVGNADVHITELMESALVTSPHGPEIAYYLAQHPEEAERIAGLLPIDQVRQMGKLEAALERATPAVAQPATKPAPQPQPKVTAAPKPPTNITGGRAPSTRSVYDDSLSYEEFERLRNEEDPRRR